MKPRKNYYILSLIFAFISLTGFSQENEAVPFAVLDEAPSFPGCANLSGDELKDCTADKITSHINKNFNTGLGKELKLEGTTRIVVKFKIDDHGNIKEVRSRSLADNANVREVLQTEATRVVSSLPQMSPGKKGGKAVTTSYALPIEFAVPQETEEKKSN